jgi:hypothetical protein
MKVREMGMKKYGFSFVSLCVVSFLIVGAASAQEETVTYETPVGMVVDYPRSWEVDNNNKYRAADPMQMIQEAVAFSAPHESADEDQRSGVALTIMDISKVPQMSPEFMLRMAIQQQKILISEFSLITPISELDLNGKDALQAEYTGLSAEGQALQTLLVYLKYEDMMVIFAYTALASDYEKYRAQAMGIIESLR